MPEQAYIPRLKTQYTDVIKGELTKEFGYKNVMQVPQLDKVVLNMGIGQAVADSKKVQSAAADLALIDTPDLNQWLYHFRPNACVAVMKSGQWVIEPG